MQLVDPEPGKLPGRPDEHREEHPVQPAGTSVVFEHLKDWLLLDFSRLSAVRQELDKVNRGWTVDPVCLSSCCD